MAHGFREHASGLLVPEDISRQREVWTKDERKLLDRATELLRSRAIALQLRCLHPDCQGPDGKMQFSRDNAGDAILRCGHKDRVFVSRI